MRATRGGRLTPADVVTLAIIAVVTAANLVGLARGAPLYGELAIHAALLAAFGALALWLRRRERAPSTAVLRGVAITVVIGVLYGTLATVSFETIPWRADAWLERADRLLFLGHSPQLLGEAWTTPLRAEALAFVYGAYIPFLYFSVFLGLIGRDGIERDEFVTGFALLYSVSYLGYLFMPAYGPIVTMADAFDAPLAEGYFVKLVHDAIDSAGGPHGAFPSLHVGASFYVVQFELRRHNLLRGLIYLPFVLLIALATIVLRYHYVVDLIAGIALAVVASRVSERWLAARRARRAEAT